MPDGPQICVNCGTAAGYPHLTECPRVQYRGEPVPVVSMVDGEGAVMVAPPRPRCWCGFANCTSGAHAARRVFDGPFIECGECGALPSEPCYGPTHDRRAL